MATFGLEMPQFLDSTLRDGEQAPGVSFTLAEKLEVAQHLDSLGVEVIEAGVPAMGGAEKALFAELVALKLRAEVVSWNRLSRSDVEASIDAGSKSLHVSVPSSDILLRGKLRRTRDAVLKDLESLLFDLRRADARVSVGAEDASRADEGFLTQIFELSQTHGAVRLRYADTLGVLDPEATKDRLSPLCQRFMVPIDFHGHNDFGLATANTLAAWKAGARVLSCTVLGLGERAGNASLEEVGAAVKFLNGKALEWDFEKLRALCENVAQASGRPIPAGKPLYGRSVFSHESGIHVDGILKDTSTYEAFDPAVFGGRRELVLGKHSGRAGALVLAREWGLPLSEARVGEFLALLRERLEADKTTDARALMAQFVGASRGPS